MPFNGRAAFTTIDCWRRMRKQIDGEIFSFFWERHETDSELAEKLD